MNELRDALTRRLLVASAVLGTSATHMAQFDKAVADAFESAELRVRFLEDRVTELGCRIRDLEARLSDHS